MLAEVLHKVLSLLKNDTGVQFVKFRIGCAIFLASIFGKKTVF